MCTSILLKARLNSILSSLKKKKKKYLLEKSNKSRLISLISAKDSVILLLTIVRH